VSARTAAAESESSAPVTRARAAPAPGIAEIGRIEPSTRSGTSPSEDGTAEDEAAEDEAAEDAAPEDAAPEDGADESVMGPPAAGVP
jgi:hypothetical protein